MLSERTFLFACLLCSSFFFGICGIFSNPANAAVVNPSHDLFVSNAVLVWCTQSVCVNKIWFSFLFIKKPIRKWNPCLSSALSFGREHWMHFALILDFIICILFDGRLSVMLRFSHERQQSAVCRKAKTLVKDIPFTFFSDLYRLCGAATEQKISHQRNLSGKLFSQHHSKPLQRKNNKCMKKKLLLTYYLFSRASHIASSRTFRIVKNIFLNTVCF